MGDAKALEFLGVGVGALALGEGIGVGKGVGAIFDPEFEAKAPGGTVLLARFEFVLVAADLDRSTAFLFANDALFEFRFGTVDDELPR